MGVFKRLSDLLKANVNDLIDRAENPEKMVKQIIVDMQKELSKSTQAYGKAKASERLAETQYNKAVKVSEDWENKAKSALAKGDQELAKKALQEESQDLATSVFAKDNLLDEINAEATTILAGYIAKHPDSVLPCLNLVSVFRKLERSGDHITNIAEEIVFFIDAKVLKHSGKVDENYPKS